MIIFEFCPGLSGLPEIFPKMIDKLQLDLAIHSTAVHIEAMHLFKTVGGSEKFIDLIKIAIVGVLRVFDRCGICGNGHNPFLELFFIQKNAYGIAI